jgi:probable FeS assembly SUF system protein SufT
MNEPKTLTRDCPAIQIPSGNLVTLGEGLEVVVTQSLGGSYTVATHQGLYRITDENADALGFEKAAPAAGAATAAPATSGGGIDPQSVWNQLKTCYDPEIPVNIVDLGLVYDCVVEGNSVLVKMTLTAPGCGMGPTICAEAQSKILSLPNVVSAEVELVWDPPWNQDMITEVGKMQLGLI